MRTSKANELLHQLNMSIGVLKEVTNTQAKEAKVEELQQHLSTVEQESALHWSRLEAALTELEANSEYLKSANEWMIQSRVLLNNDSMPAKQRLTTAEARIFYLITFQTIFTSGKYVLFLM